MPESPDVMAERLSALARELRAARREADEAAVLAGALAIHLDSNRTSVVTQRVPDSPPRSPNPR
jgi:hypothetical protein